MLLDGTARFQALGARSENHVYVRTCLCQANVTDERGHGGPIMNAPPSCLMSFSCCVLQVQQRLPSAAVVCEHTLLVEL